MGIMQNRDSPVTKFSWEPRISLVTSILLVLGVIALETSLFVTTAFLLAVTHAVSSSVSVRMLLSRLSVVIPFLLLMTLPLIFGAGWPPDPGRIEMTVLLVMKSLTSIVLIVTLLAYNSFADYLSALAWLGFPREMVAVLFLTYRFLHLYVHELDSIRRVLADRLLQDVPVRRSLKVYGQIAGGLLLKALDSADEVYRAMKSRCYTGEMKMSNNQSIRGPDIVRSVMILLPMIILIIAERWWL